MSDFIGKIAPIAVEIGRQGNVLPSLIIAQGILESGSGTSELAVGANNLFGIKKGTGWTGEVYPKNSAEWSEEKGWYSVVSDFRKYPSIRECIQDLVNKYNTMARYSAVVGQIVPEAAVQAVFAAGYATDPTYPEKLINIINQYDLRQYDTQEYVEPEPIPEPPGEDPIDLEPVTPDPELPINEGVIEMVNPANILINVEGGHGPDTPGKETPYISALGRKIQEEEFNFPTARYLLAELKRHGFKTMQTHNESYDVPLTTRTNKANAAGADLFVSIHFNAMGNTMNYSTASGFSCHIQEGLSNLSSSYKMAQLMIQELARGTKQVNRGIVKQNLAVTRQSKMTAVLVECGFMDDPVEALLMLNTQFQKEVAAELCKAICRYYGVTYKSPVDGGPIPVSNPQPISNKFYRVRLSWADAGSQKGAFLDLAEAKKLADSLKGNYEVYDWNGKEVYDPTPEVVKPAAPEPDKLYRVRKSWADADSQLIASSTIDGAKAVADKNLTHKVFDGTGRMIYDPAVAAKAELERLAKEAAEARKAEMIKSLAFLKFAIVMNSKADYDAARLVHLATGYPMFERGALFNRKVADTVIGVGGTADELADNNANTVKMITGKTATETMAAAEAFIKSL